jgi:anti-sigma B factor antagonist
MRRAARNSRSPGYDRHQAEPLTEIVRDGETTLVRLAGDVDMATVPLVQEALERECDRGPVRLTLDLADVQFLDSSAMNLLVSIHRELRARGCRLILANPSEVVAHTMQIAQLDRLLAVTNTAGQPESAHGLDEELRTRAAQAGDRAAG